jgi:hypothetical protein
LLFGLVQRQHIETERMECQEGEWEHAKKAKASKRGWAPGPIAVRPRTPPDEVAAREFIRAQREKEKEPPFESREAARERLMWENQQRNEEHIVNMARIREEKERRDRVGDMQAWRERERERVGDMQAWREREREKQQQGF